MLEDLGVEVRAEVGVHHPEDVPVELRGHCGGVVVGGVEPGFVLHEVETHEERVARLELPRQRTQEGGDPVRMEVPHRPREKQRQASAPAPRAGRSSRKSPTIPRTSRSG